MRKVLAAISAIGFAISGCTDGPAECRRNGETVPCCVENGDIVPCPSDANSSETEVSDDIEKNVNCSGKVAEIMDHTAWAIKHSTPDKYPDSFDYSKAVTHITAASEGVAEDFQCLNLDDKEITRQLVKKVFENVKSTCDLHDEEKN